MGKNSKIEWTDHTFNPWIGCTKVSPGCDNCYAEITAGRFKMAEWGAGKPRRLSSDDYWKQPLAWEKVAAKHHRRMRVFCASLADVFDNEVPQEWRQRLWDLITATPHLDWLILTKRIGNAQKMLPADWGAGWANVWLGISIVNQEEADRDIIKLTELPASIRFLSIEPLLAPISLRWLDGFDYKSQQAIGIPVGEYDGIKKIKWIIVGGESGAQARPMHPDWVRKLRDQCREARIAFFFKQWGEYQPLSTTEGRQQLPFGTYVLPNGEHKGFGFIKKGKVAAGRMLDGQKWNEIPRSL